MFINLSNHPSNAWSSLQLEEAKQYGDIKDIPFPQVNPYLSDNEINTLVEKYLCDILAYNPKAVMLQGEYIFTYRLINRLKENHIKVVASCSDRRTIEYVDDKGFTERKSEFEFVNFKEY